MQPNPDEPPSHDDQLAGTGPDSARRVSADLHKCSLGEAVSAKVQAKTRPYNRTQLSYILAMSVKRL
jgi:hypothetical protein